MARVLAAVLAGKAVGVASRALGRGGGTALPGLVAEWIAPDIIARLTRELGRGAVIVTGTNGKTTTSRMLAGIIDAGGAPVLHNRSGSNLMRGLAASLTEAASITGHLPNGRRTAGVFEVDEATLPPAASAIRPRVITFTNLFRDQLDRYGEVDSIAALWRRALTAPGLAPAIVLNADDPSVSALRRHAPGRIISFGVEDQRATGDIEQHPADARWCAICGAEFTYTTRFFWHVGHWSCPGCGDRRPVPEIAATAVEPRGEHTRITITHPSGSLDVNLPLVGLYNVYNALAATAAALAIDVPAEAIIRGLERFTAAFGRQEALSVHGREVQIFLCKNPAGVNQVLHTVLSAGSSPVSMTAAGSRHDANEMGRAGTDNSPEHDTSPARAPTGLHLLLILNDGIADGRDISWIWDVDFELLAGRVASIVVSGSRAAEMALRLKYAALGDRLVVVDDIRAAGERALALTPDGGRLYVLPTYTAMLTTREHLASLAGQSRFWEQ